MKVRVDWVSEQGVADSAMCGFVDVSKQNQTENTLSSIIVTSEFGNLTRMNLFLH